MTNPTFEALSLRPEMLTAITKMGFTEATAVQAEAIPVIRSGVDVLAQSQTGTGKTLAFAIPAVECIDPQEHAVQVLVLSPTRELSQQCADEIRKISRLMPHIKTADIFGGASYTTQFRDLRTANLVIGTPGRVMDHMDRESLKLGHLKMIVLDEADEMLNMGFKEDIETILKDAAEDRQIVLFSATIPKEILAITKQFQKNPVQINVNQSQAMLDNIQQLYVDVPMYQKAEALKLLMHKYKPHRAIIFANTKSMVEELVEQLGGSGFYTQGIHGDMKQMQRTGVMQGFKNGKINVLVATDVAARGIDVSDIDYVFNFDIPKMSEYYVHRIGRTGRAGRTGTAITLCCGKRQILQLQQVARRTKSTIAPILLPTLADIELSNAQRDMGQVIKALEATPSPAHEKMIADLVEQGHDPSAIAAALVGLAFKHTMKGLVEVKHGSKVSLHQQVKLGGDSKGESRSKPESGAPDRKRLKSPFVDIVITVGSANRVGANHIVGAITEVAGISSKSIGHINIANEYSVVGVPANQMDDILLAMQGVKICGKPVTAMPLAEPTGKRGGSTHFTGHRGKANHKPFGKNGKPFSKGSKPFKRDKKN